MRRREFIRLLSSAAAAWPLAARAQLPDRVRRIGVLMGIAERDLTSPGRIAAFKQRLQELGWTEGRNVRIDYRWAAGEADRAQAGAKELVGMQPDVIVAHTIAAAIALRQETQIIPIVFTVVSAPEGAGLVESLARPGGNITGFTNMEPTLGGKWLETLKEIAPSVTRVAVMFNPEASRTAVPFSRSAEAAAPKFAVEAIMTAVHEPSEIELVMATLAREPGGGLILPPDIFTTTHRQLIIELAARHRLPAIYPYRYFVAEGGLVSYGTDIFDFFRQAATYVDRILRGANPGELPVQAPTRFEFVINLKTAKALGLTVPPVILVAADEVIE